MANVQQRRRKNLLNDHLLDNLREYYRKHVLNEEPTDDGHLVTYESRQVLKAMAACNWDIWAYLERQQTPPCNKCAACRRYADDVDFVDDSCLDNSVDTTNDNSEESEDSDEDIGEEKKLPFTVKIRWDDYKNATNDLKIYFTNSFRKPDARKNLWGMKLNGKKKQNLNAEQKVMMDIIECVSTKFFVSFQSVRRVLDSCLLTCYKCYNC
ncbi:uncharacterized protein LOC126264254 [Aethina tumida]|uniref:uncharacterized protein LOC126264254 n=1 Tax=Aethina tumida TaxID=116153 RepID=UPI002148ECA2|nr:uncharacterized protein LOC126264254 [Aethina tumida]